MRNPRPASAEHTERTPRLSMTAANPNTNPTGEPPAKPLRADARRNRALVLQAARSAFASEGLAVPLDEIARRAGVGPGTVYRHFPTKDALFAAVIVDVLEALCEQADELVQSPDPGAAFFAFVTGLITTGATNQAIFDALSGAPEEVQSACATVSEQLSAALDALLTRAQGADAVRNDVTAADLKALLVGALAAQTAAAPDATPARLVQVTCDGLRTPRSIND